MKLIIYVEGISDKAGLQALLEPIVAAASRRKLGISFSPQEGKAPIDSASTHPGSSSRKLFTGAFACIASSMTSKP